MGITEILRRIWLFSANKIKSNESFSTPAHCRTQLINVALLGLVSIYLHKMQKDQLASKHCPILPALLQLDTVIPQILYNLIIKQLVLHNQLYLKFMLGLASVYNAEATVGFNTTNDSKGLCQVNNESWHLGIFSIIVKHQSGVVYDCSSPLFYCNFGFFFEID